MNDLAVYRAGGLAVVHGRDVYALHATIDHLPFTYPPFAAIVFAPLSVLPWAADQVVVGLGSAVLLWWCLHRVVRRLDDEGSLRYEPQATWVIGLFAAAIWLEPFRTTIKFGQINVLVMALVVADVLAAPRTRAVGFRIGIAAALKLTPLAFIPLLIVLGRWRAALRAMVAFIGCGLLAFAIDPADSRRYWGDRLFLDAHRVGRVENASNQSVRGVLARLLKTTHVPGWWIAIAVAVFVLALAVAARLYRDDQTVAATAVMALAELLASPISWSHHWVWSAVMLAVCVDLVRRTRSRWIATASAAILLPMFLGVIRWAPQFRHLELTDSPLQELASATYLLAGIGFVALVGITGGRPGLRAGTP